MLIVCNVQDVIIGGGLQPENCLKREEEKPIINILKIRYYRIYKSIQDS